MGRVCRAISVFLPSLLHLSFAVQLIKTSNVGGYESTACSSDADCPLSDERSKCCPIDGTFTYGCKPGVTDATAAASNCSAPGGASSKATQCSCSTGESCFEEGGRPWPSSKWPYPEAKPGMKQWLIFGDSISWGLLAEATAKAAKTGIQLVHTPTNNKNVWWGLRCADKWFGSNPARWDIISFNFGLHDLSMSLERIEPALYGTSLASFAHKVHTVSPQAALLWATTTPAPDGSERPCVPSQLSDPLGTTWGGCPPRAPADVPVYNKVAEDSLKSTALNIQTVDLYSVVTAKCGQRFSECRGFQRPKEVHYDVEGNDALAEAYVAAAVAAMEGKV